jgi:hypothetical protein
VNVGGVFGKSVDLQHIGVGEQNFGEHHRYHSSQFRSFYALRYPYWVNIMRIIKKDPVLPKYLETINQPNNP